MTRSFPALFFAFALAAIAGCNRQSRDVNDFFPLEVGHDWVYEVTSANKETSTLEFHILGQATGDRGEKRYFLDEDKSRFYVRHGDVIAYSISPDIWTVFLSGPLRKGNKFDGGLATDEPLFVHDATVSPVATPGGVPPPPQMYAVKSAGYKLVTAVNRKITVPAGSFEDCLEVTHLAGPTTGVKYFAPGIGMVYAEAYFDNPKTGTRSLVTRQQLSYYRVGGKEGGSLPARTAPIAPLTTSTSSP